MAQSFTISRDYTTTGVVTHQGGVTTNGELFSTYRRDVVSGATATLTQAQELIGVTYTTTGTCTITLPRINDLTTPDHKKCYTVVDEGGNASNNNITIECHADDEVLGAASTVINQNYGSMRFYSVDVDGTSGRWFCAAAVPS